MTCSKKNPAGHRPVEHLGEGELRLQDREVVAVAGGAVRGRERVRQERQPLAQQRVDPLRAQAVADRLHGGDVVDGGEGVVQGGVADPGPGGLPLGPLMAVKAQPGVVREVRAELEEERAEVGVHRIDVEVVDQAGRLDDPRIGLALGVAAFLGPKQRRLLLRPPDEQHPLGVTGRLERGQVLVHHVVLALSLDEVHPRHPLVTGEAAHRGAERVGDPGQRCRRSDRQPQLPVDVADEPGRVLQLRHVDVEVHPVDALHLEDHVLGDDLGHGAR